VQNPGVKLKMTMAVRLVTDSGKAIPEEHVLESWEHIIDEIGIASKLPRVLLAFLWSTRIVEIDYRHLAGVLR
jgi:hypothetical protein